MEMKDGRNPEGLNAEKMNAVLPPAIVKVVCSFQENRHGRYQVYWGNTGEPGPYTLRLLNGTAELAKKTGIYGSAASVEGDLPEGASCFLQLYPENMPTEDSLRVPSGPLCVLEEAGCEREGKHQVALRLKYQMSSPLPERLLVSLDGGEGNLRLVPLGVFENRIDLGALGLAERSSCVVRLGGSYLDRGAVIETEPDAGNPVEVALVRPRLSELAVELAAGPTAGPVAETEDGMVKLTGKLAAEGEGKWTCRLYSGSRGSAACGEFEAVLQSDKRTLTCRIPFGSFPEGLSRDCTVAMVCKKAKGIGPESERMALPLSLPRPVEAGYADSEQFFVRLAETGGEPRLCRALIGSQTVDFSGERITLPFSAGKSVKLAWVAGTSRGPLTGAISSELPAYRIGKGTGKENGKGEGEGSGQNQDQNQNQNQNQNQDQSQDQNQKDQAFLYYAKDAEQATKVPITVELRLQRTLTAPVTAGVFSVGASVEGICQLSMSEKVWPDHCEYDGAQVEKDLEALYSALEMAGLGAGDVRLVQEAVADFLPQLLDRQLFYRFRLRRRSCDLLPGMRVLVESSQVQWSDDPDGSGYFVGFSGGQMLELPVVQRGERLGLDGFLPHLTGYADSFEQPDRSNYGKLAGGAGSVDLGRAQLCQPYLRIHYPESFPSHTKQGELLIGNNEWVAAAASLEVLERDTLTMEKQGYLDPPSAEQAPEQAYLVFLRGRAHLTPRLCVQVKGHPQWVSVGTTLGDLRRELDEDLVLIRNGVPAEPVLSEVGLLNEICLAPGDRLVDRDVK